MSFFIVLKHCALFSQMLWVPTILWVWLLFAERHQPPQPPGNGAKLLLVPKHNIRETKNTARISTTLAIRSFFGFHWRYCDILVVADFSRGLKTKRTNVLWVWQSTFCKLGHSMMRQFTFFTKTSHSGLHSVVYIKYCLFIKLGPISQLTILIK